MVRQLRKIILASRSPARRQLLREAGLKIGLFFSDVDERRLPKETVGHYAVRVALSKAKKAAESNKKDIIIGVDTVIAHGKKIFGKPRNVDEASCFLKQLSGKWHKVYSGTIVIDSASGKILKKLVISRVKFINLTNKQISWYIKTGEPIRAAGAYSIQNKGCALVATVDGCLANVIGISLGVVMKMLKTLNAIKY